MRVVVIVIKKLFLVRFDVKKALKNEKRKLCARHHGPEVLDINYVARHAFPPHRMRFKRNSKRLLAEQLEKRLRRMKYSGAPFQQSAITVDAPSSNWP
ncbi:hypothetical protein J6590_056055 [Homalodisca vitripennis]|nr:hypothetical protein J6590_056055 [Homalodisca vitripennis]